MTNIRHQIKSKWYYIFWGACAVAVVGGQFYVGSGYREMAEATKNNITTVHCAPPYRISVYPYQNRTGEFE